MHCVANYPTSYIYIVQNAFFATRARHEHAHSKSKILSIPLSGMTQKYILENSVFGGLLSFK